MALEEVGQAERQKQSTILSTDPFTFMTRSRSRLVLHEPREVRAVHVIHHHEVLPLVQADFMDGDDVRVLQAAGGGVFDAETANPFGAGQ